MSKELINVIALSMLFMFAITVMLIIAKKDTKDVNEGRYEVKFMCLHEVEYAFAPDVHSGSASPATLTPVYNLDGTLRKCETTTKEE